MRAAQGIDECAGGVKRHSQVDEADSSYGWLAPVDAQSILGSLKPSA